MSWNTVNTAKEIRDPSQVTEKTAVAMSASSQQIGPFDKQTYFVRICGTAGFHYTTGVNAVATANSAYLGAGQPEIVRINPGEVVAIIRDGTNTGNVTVTEMA